jgi:molybdopterin-guanine dinucleotide biosynthesis protein A
MDFDLVVPAGGTGRRLGGVDKGALRVAGASLLDRVLRAGAGARRTVVVGEPRPTGRPVDWTREEPPGGGPLAGLAAGVARLPPDDGARVIVVLATDLPWVGPTDVERLLAALAGDGSVEAAVFTDDEGRWQPLAAAYRAGPLRAALTALEPVTGRPVRLVPERLAVAPVRDRGAAADCDTPDQLARARDHFERQD